eukprot:Skav200787  [mRNA]  locus=scaffold318:51268:53013:- [translate_table: standard]
MSYAWAVLDELSQPTSRKRPPAGPCSVLLQRLEQLGWHWDQGFVDQFGIPIHLWDCCIQELGTRVREAWQQVVMVQLESRKTFQGASMMHAGFTQRTKLLDPSKAKLLRQSLVGTFYTADRLKHRDPEATDLCHYCGNPDSPFHRHVECEHFHAERCLTPSQQSQLADMPLVAGSHGWFAPPPTLLAFRRKLATMVDTTDVIYVPPQLPDQVDLFTGGSCLHATDAFLRLATWGVACATPAGAEEHVAIASGVVVVHQTVSRAELTGVIAALQWVTVVRRPFRLWIDNQYAWKKLSRMWHSATWYSKPTSPNHDLLDKLFSLVLQVRPFHLGTLKVVSHQVVSNLTPIEQWVCLGNEAADRAAEQALWSEPELRRLHGLLVEEVQSMTSLIDNLHATIVNIGEKVVKEVSPAAAVSVSVVEAPSVPAPFQPWPFPVDLPAAARKYVIDDWGFVQPWLQTLQEGEHVRMWSWHQLYADFQLHFPGKGPWHNLDRQRWESGDTMPDVPFTKRSRWLTDNLQGIAKVLDLSIPWCKAQPASNVLAFWTNCINVRVDDDRQLAVDKWLSTSKAVYKCSKDLHVLT